MASLLVGFRRAALAGVGIVRATAQAFFGVNGPFLSAGLAFYVLLYCFPLLLLFVTALGYTLADSEQVMSQVQPFVTRLVPASERAVMATLEQVVANRGLLGAVSILFFFLFGTFLFAAVRHVLNTVFGVTTRRSFLAGAGADVMAMLGTGGLLALAVGAASVVAFLVDIGARIPVLAPVVGSGWVLTGRVLSIVFSWALLYLLYRVAPAKSLSRRGRWVAASTGVVLLELSKALFQWYAEAATDYAVFYGALGGIVFFVLWLYYASTVFVLAATLGRVTDVFFDEERASRLARPA
jgi:membrane protein